MLAEIKIDQSRKVDVPPDNLTKRDAFVKLKKPMGCESIPFKETKKYVGGRLNLQ